MKASKGELALALAFAALGVLWIARAATMPLWDGFAPASGFMPLWYGLILVGLSAAVALRSHPVAEEPVAKALVVLGVVAATIVGLKLAGFVPAIFLMLLALFVAVEKLPAVRSAAAAAGVTATLYLVFRTWLGVPLP